MKKRKKPVVLVTILVVCIAVAVGFNLAGNLSNQPPEAPQAPKTDTKPIGESRPAESSKSTAASVKAQLGGKVAQAPGPEGPADMEKPKEPMVLQKPASTKIQKPTPNESSISTQWYSPEAATKK